VKEVTMPKPPTTSAQPPEEVRVLVLGGPDLVAAGGDHLGGKQTA